eukprot:1157123-Pelagomonas_calceolata.AAC.4
MALQREERARSASEHEATSLRGHLQTLERELRNAQVGARGPCAGTIFPCNAESASGVTCRPWNGSNATHGWEQGGLVTAAAFAENFEFDKLTYFRVVGGLYA